MTQPYTKHLCTFMGRKSNLTILMQYIERALKIDAIDNYWMIDMTRNLDDHEYIFEQQQRLNELYPGRVHLHNRDERRKLLDQGEDAVRGSIGGWGTFYSFLKRFNDNDIIAKCDDDTLYIDVETLAAAYELRWQNKDPYIMHANCINNGLTAYHQKRLKNIWPQQDVTLYPTCGLTGPLFSHPEIACDHHIKFCNDLKVNSANVDKYKLKQNIYFCNRVSINFIFMLGADRGELSKIDEQDEYETSSKIPQRVDRPNMIIGDFTIAHHTYGVQEPVMEEKGTYDHYKSLAEKIFSVDGQFDKNKEITLEYNPVSAIKRGNNYLMNTWASGNRVAIKNLRTEKYLALEHNSRERTIGPEKKPTGKHLTKSVVIGQDEPMLWYVEDGMIRTGAEILKTTPHKPDAERFNSHLINIFYRGNYKINKFKHIQSKPGKYKLESAAAPGMFLIHKVLPNGKEMFMIEKMDRGDADDWEFEEITPNDRPVVGQIVRNTPGNIDNDHTFSVSDVLPKNDMTRGFYWMVTEYIWEFIPRGDNYIIKLIADDKPDMFLNKNKDDVVTGNQQQLWKLTDGIITHSTGGSITEDAGVYILTNKGTKFNIGL